VEDTKNYTAILTAKHYYFVELQIAGFTRPYNHTFPCRAQSNQQKLNIFNRTRQVKNQNARYGHTFYILNHHYIQ